MMVNSSNVVATNRFFLTSAYLYIHLNITIGCNYNLHPKKFYTSFKIYLTAFSALQDAETMNFTSDLNTDNQFCI